MLRVPAAAAIAAVTENAHDTRPVTSTLEDILFVSSVTIATNPSKSQSVCISLYEFDPLFAQLRKKNCRSE